jgi:glyoxylase-like metal-dependent hydrolase (beta-lactamase superfamily II)
VSQDKPTPVGALVTAGDAQTAAEPITDTIFMVKDISNAYLVTTGDGDLLVNTGFIGNGTRNKALFAPHRTGPLRRIVLTQAHPDHYGAVPENREPDTQVIVGAGFFDTVDYFARLDPFLKRRSGKLWASMTRRGGAAPVPPKITAEIEVADRLAFAQGGRRFEVIKVPGGESLDSVIVWLPDERTVFTGNLFGPVWRSLPNLTTTRGDKPRLVRPYLRSVELVRDLSPELVVTGHGEPVRGAATIRADLEAMHGAVSYIERETIAGMNAGKDVHALMREIVLPDALRIGEFHGNTRWTVRAIWEENTGWIKYEEGTTGLYGVPRAAVDAELGRLAGPDALARHAEAHVAGGRPLEALHLLEVALAAAPGHHAALAVKKTALEHLQVAGGGTNLSETMWLRAELAEIEQRLAGQAAPAA